MLFSRRNKPHAKAIPLREWQDPVEDVAILLSERRCTVYFSVGESEKIGRLSFEGVWATRSVRTEVAPFDDTASGYSSYIIEVFDSSWPAEVEHGFYTESARARLYNESRHFLVKGHDVYHEVLCRGYVEAYLSPGELSFPYAKQCLASAEP
jgi:hypothetical protein